MLHIESDIVYLSGECTHNRVTYLSQEVSSAQGYQLHNSHSFQISYADSEMSVVQVDGRRRGQ